MIPKHRWRTICLPQKKVGEDPGEPSLPPSVFFARTHGVGSVPPAEADTFVGFLSLSNLDCLLMSVKKSRTLS